MAKKVLVVGGGIAGPVTAMALQKAGLEPVVYEAYGRGADGVGAFLTLATNGIEALGVLGLDGLVAGLGVPTRRMRVVSGTGKVLADFDNGGLTASGLPSQTVKRADLYGALRDEAVRRGVRVEYGKRLTFAGAEGGGVRASFADGTQAEGDLLVGADGLRSTARKLIDPRAPDARYVGLLNLGGFARGAGAPGEPGVFYMLFGRRCFFGYLTHPTTGDTWWFANPARKAEPPAAELAAITPAEWRAELMGLFRDDAGPACQIIEATENILPGWATYDFPTVPVWHNGRMIIVGDAAHATSPASGQGASMAIEDAVVLAQCLRDISSTAHAFAAYERLRRGRVERIVVQGKRNGSQKAPGPVGRVLRDLFMPIVMRQIAARNSLHWMYDYRIDWGADLSGAAAAAS